MSVYSTVRRAAAWREGEPGATGRSIAATRTATRHFGRRNHFELLNDPEVYAHMRDCITR